jgi:hypothetical protein
VCVSCQIFSADKFEQVSNDKKRPLDDTNLTSRLGESGPSVGEVQGKDRRMRVSTLAYSKLTTMREETSPPPPVQKTGVKNYVDAMAALVPSEVLALHAVIVSVAIKTGHDAAGNPTTIVAEPVPLRFAFWGLIVFSIALYIAPRPWPWPKSDLLRAAIPPLAFVAWTMLQRATAFDAVFPGVSDVTRDVIAYFAAAALGFLANTLAGTADRATPRRTTV